MWRLFLAIGLTACAPEQGERQAKDRAVVDPDPTTVQAFRGSQVTRLATHQVDVLVLVDSSCSMVEEMNPLQAFGPALLDAVDALQLDARIGVLDMDVANPLAQGKLRARSGYRWVDAQTLEPEAVLGQMLSTGIAGSGQQNARETLELAIQSHASLVNQDFLRADAHLAIVTISDDNDELPLELDWITGVLDSTRSPLTWWQHHAIVSDDESCPYEVGTTHIELSEASGGSVQTICNPDWDPMPILAPYAATELDTFVLPVPAWTLQGPLIAEHLPEAGPAVDLTLVGFDPTERVVTVDPPIPTGDRVRFRTDL